MKWFRLFTALLILAVAVGAVWHLVGQETALIGVGFIVITFVVFSVIMDDSHSRWIALTRNVPVWGLWIAVPATIALVIPAVWQVAGAIWAVIKDVVSVQLCLPPLISLIVVLILAMFLKRRNHRRRPAQPPVDGN